MFTIAGGIILAAIFLSAPGFFIGLGIALFVLALVGGLLIAYWGVIVKNIWWILGGFILLGVFTDRPQKKETPDVSPGDKDPA